MRTEDSQDSRRVVPFRRERNATLDTIRWSDRKAAIPILLEVDVTETRRLLRARRRAGDGPGFTAWVVACVARAAAEHPRLHALRKGRRKLVLFHAVDVAVLVEKPLPGAEGDETLPMPFVVRDAHRKEPSEIHREIREARDRAADPGAADLERGVPARLQSLFFRLPAFLRDLLFWRWLVRSPTRIRRTMGTVVVSAVGMTTPGILAWGVPRSLHPLAVGVGGIARRSTPEGVREVLALTVVFDHAVTDGAPAGRFVHRLHQLLSGAEGLEGDGAERPEPTPR